MCIIVDANVAADIANDNPSDASRMVVDWVTNRGGRIVHGGYLTSELFRIERLKRWFAQLQRAGRLMSADAIAVNARTDELTKSGACKSDDPHVIALAQISGARLLYSADTLLHEDFTSAALLSKPRGSVFQRIDHEHLIRASRCVDGAC